LLLHFRKCLKQDLGKGSEAALWPRGKVFAQRTERPWSHVEGLGLSTNEERGVEKGLRQPPGEGHHPRNRKEPVKPKKVIPKKNGGEKSPCKTEEAGGCRKDLL